MFKVLDNFKKELEARKNYRNNLRSIKDFDRAMANYETPLYISGTEGDIRYNNPKKAHKASLELIDDTIESTEIYKRAKELILNAQRSQVGYGLDKYPEPLNADTWSILESFDHAIDEAVDKLHYLVMARIQMEELMEELEQIRKHKERSNSYIRDEDFSI